MTLTPKITVTELKKAIENMRTVAGYHTLTAAHWIREIQVYDKMIEQLEKEESEESWLVLGMNPFGTITIVFESDKEEITRKEFNKLIECNKYPTIVLWIETRKNYESKLKNGFKK